MKPALCSLILFISIIVYTYCPSFAQNKPIFDAHIHYNKQDWDFISPEQVLAVLDRADIDWAIVSSIPNEGTLMLHDKAPQSVVPFLRPFRSQEDKNFWHTDQEILIYVGEELKKGLYKGVGEVDLPINLIDKPVVKSLLELAITHQMFFQIDANEEVVEELLKTHPDLKIIWAHAGRAKPTTLGRILKKSKSLWVELAGRSDIAINGHLDPSWRDLFLRYPDRFMVGSGFNTKKTIIKFLSILFHSNDFFKVINNIRSTWVTSRWESIIDETSYTQNWLKDLPPDIANQIAYENGHSLFGIITKTN